MNKKYHIRIVMNEPYPYGMAVTNRIHYYAKGFLAQGDDVEIILPRAKQKIGNPAMNQQIKGIYDEVQFIYTAGRTIRSGSSIKNKISDIRGLTVAFLRIVGKRNKTDFILLVSNLFTHAVIFKIAALFSGAQLILEKSEVPFKKRKESFYTQIYCKYVFRLFDAVLVISNFLEVYFRDRTSKYTKIIKVPILVDSKEFNKPNASEADRKDKTIVYTGTLDQYKDGIRTLLESFRLLLKNRQDVKLICIGRYGSQADKKWIDEFITKNNLEEFILIPGYISREKMLNYLANASVLALAKPNNKQSNACFPTKIGEYLLTGKPVVVTSTGETNLYLENEVNAYITKPNNAEEFSSALRNALENEEKSREIGRNGRETAIKQFDYTVNVKRIRALLTTGKKSYTYEKFSK